MKVVIQCIWQDPDRQPDLPLDLWEYDPLQQLIRSRTCEAGLLPFSILQRAQPHYAGVVEPSPAYSSYASIHEATLPVVEMFLDDSPLIAVNAVPLLLPEGGGK